MIKNKNIVKDCFLLIFTVFFKIKSKLSTKYKIKGLKLLVMSIKSLKPH